MKYFLLFLLL